jgi:hypothetical protein
MMGTLAINLRPAEASGVGGLTRKSPHTDLLPLEYLVAAEPAPTYTPVAPPDAAITGRIHIIRGQKIMLDRDLAELYGVETKHLKRQVRRNLGRFPEDFMPACRTGRFELTAVEWATLRYQFGTSKDEMLSERGGSRVLPMAFTEQGVAMLSSVLNSEPAFAGRQAGHPGQHPYHSCLLTYLPAGRQVREVLLSHREILQKLEQLEGRITGHDEEIQAIFDHLTELVSPAEQARKPIGFKPEASSPSTCPPAPNSGNCSPA